MPPPSGWRSPAPARRSKRPATTTTSSTTPTTVPPTTTTTLPAYISFIATVKPEVTNIGVFSAPDQAAPSQQFPNPWLYDQSNPASVPGLYTKLISVDKADLLVGPYGTNFVAPAMPTIIQNKKMTISFTAIGINDKFKYDKYFSMVSVGPQGVNRLTRRPPCAGTPPPVPHQRV